jgi:hypothetical protein
MKGVEQEAPTVQSPALQQAPSGVGIGHEHRAPCLPAGLLAKSARYCAKDDLPIAPFCKHDKHAVAQGLPTPTAMQSESTVQDWS